MRHRVWVGLALVGVSLTLLGLVMTSGCGGSGTGAQTLEPPATVAAIDPAKVVTDDASGLTYVSDEVLVYVSDAATAAEFDALLDSVDGEVVGGLRQVGLFQVRFRAVTDKADWDARCATLRGSPLVRNAAPNLFEFAPEPIEGDDTPVVQGEASARRTTNDPLYSNATHSWDHTACGAWDAWDSATGSEDTVLAIVDFGFQNLDHQDVAPNVGGTSSINSDYTCTDHGIHVAGIAAARGNNGLGIAGVCWVADLRLIDIAGSGCGGGSTDIMSGFIAAAEGGARVINYSGGISSATPPSEAYNIYEQQLWTPVLQYIDGRGCLVVTSAGNNNDPARGRGWKGLGNNASITNLLVVASAIPTGWTGPYNWDAAAWAAWEGAGCPVSRSSFSCYGQCCRIAAPGSYIASATGSTGYAFKSGTSMASPYVAGAAGLLFSVDPSLTPQQVRDLILNNASATQTITYPAIPAGTDPRFPAEPAGTIPLIDVDAALGAVPNSGLPTAVLLPDPQALATPEYVDFDMSASSPGVGAQFDGTTTWTLSYGDGTPDLTGTGQPTTATHYYGAVGGYTARLTVTNTLGNTDSISVSIGVGQGDVPVIIN